MRTTRDIVHNAWKAGTVVPGFNIPYLPMMEPVVRALRDTRCFGLVMVARLEWVKFEARSPRAVRDEYERVKDERFTRLHLDHVPVVDEDGKRVDFEAVFTEALGLGYQSVMVDGSRLPLEENIVATRRATEMAHAAGVPVEAELGAVFGHESGPSPSYEEMFVSGRGFTDPGEAARFVETTGADWLSVAIGNIHGAISPSRKDEKKVRARLHIEHLERIRRATRVPLVLHGGTGIPKECVREAVKHGIAKINVGAGIRQPFEALAENSVEKAREAVYETVVRIVREELEIENSAAVVNP
jgi:fructose-bisphosphate aldolase, class II